MTLAFALAMAVVLAGAGYLLYARLDGSLDRAIDQGLRSRVADVGALVQQADNGLSQSSAGGRGAFAQVLDARGRIFDETPGLAPTPLLRGALLARALGRPLLIDRTAPGGEHVRLAAGPVAAQGQRLVVVAGTSLETRDRALAGLRHEILVGGPLALLLVSLLGYGLAAAALAPVERMRLRAAALSSGLRGERLPVPGGRDELGRLGETLNELLGRLEQGIERERRFVADASHELRTPLALLRTEIELALDEPRTSLELEAALASAGEETDRLVQLAEDLLLLARVDRGKLPLRRAPTDLDEVLAGVATRFARRATADGRAIEVRPSGITVVADRLRLEQALGNLIENALRHGAGTVSLRADGRRDAVALHVTDEGGGFPPAFVEHALERFARADAGRAGAGSGLGLAIVEEIARAHGGSARAGNRAEGGADVAIVLPAVALREQAVE